MPAAERIREHLSRILAILHDAGIPHMATGALGRNALAPVRTSMDLDIVRDMRGRSARPVHLVWLHRRRPPQGRPGLAARRPRHGPSGRGEGARAGGPRAGGPGGAGIGAQSGRLSEEGAGSARAGCARGGVARVAPWLWWRTGWGCADVEVRRRRGRSRWVSWGGRGSPSTRCARWWAHTTPATSALTSYRGRSARRATARSSRRTTRTCPRVRMTASRYARPARPGKAARVSARTRVARPSSRGSSRKVSA